MKIASIRLEDNNRTSLAKMLCPGFPSASRKLSFRSFSIANGDKLVTTTLQTPSVPARWNRATYASMPFHFLAGGLHPDHDTLANFRKTFLPALQDLFVHILLYAQEIGVLPLGNISLDGTKIHADASKSSAISDKRLLALDSQRRTEVDKLFALTEHAEQTEMPEGLVIADDIAFRQERLANLAKAKAVLEARA